MRPVGEERLRSSAKLSHLLTEKFLAMAKMHLQRPVVVGSNRPGSAFTAVYPGSVAAVLDRWSTVCVWM